MINLLQQMGLTQSLSHYTQIPFPCKLARSSGPHYHRERTLPDEDWTIHSTFSDATEDKFISPLIVLIHIQIHDFIHVNRLRLSDPSPNKQKESLIFGWENLTIYQESFDISPNNKFSVAKKTVSRRSGDNDLQSNGLFSWAGRAYPLHCNDIYYKTFEFR